ncbi:TPA: putative DNA-binding domain-containing protein [Legionella pneumophila]|nr:putative DNA-binding domain-containing protein [Legionella pneumophila]
MTHRFQLVQHTFTEFVRGKSEQLPPGVSLEQMQLYQSLAFTNLNEVISPCFPVLHSIVPRKLWSELLKQFLLVHQATTPLFHQVAHEFVSFLKGMALPNYPFIYALAHYEWMEADVEMAPEDIPTQATQPFQLLDAPLQLASTARLLHYEYDVEHISMEYQPKNKVPTFLIVFRDDKNKVQFIKLNQLSYIALQIMQYEQLTARQVIQHVIELYPSLDLTHLVSNYSIFIAGLYDEGVLRLG